jgi:hypothetical protein
MTASVGTKLMARSMKPPGRVPGAIALTENVNQKVYKDKLNI